MNPQQPTNLFFRKRATRYGEVDYRIFTSEIPNPQAAFAMHLAEKLGLVAGEVDGEDSAGRQKLRLLTSGEVAQRACAIAADTWEQFRKRGWLLDVPVPDETPEEPPKAD